MGRRRGNGVDGRCGSRPDQQDRARGMVDHEPGLKCPRCSTFAGEWVKDILTALKYTALVTFLD